MAAGESLRRCLYLLSHRRDLSAGATGAATRETEGSKFVQTIRLSAGDARNRVEFGNVIDLNTRSANLKATFPLSASNPMATYNWDVGTVQRATNDEKKFEVPSH